MRTLTLALMVSLGMNIWLAEVCIRKSQDLEMICFMKDRNPPLKFDCQYDFSKVECKP